MITIVSQKSSIVTQLSLNLTPKQRSSKVAKPNERPLIPGLDLIIVNNYKVIIILNDILSPAHPIEVAQAKARPKDQIRAILPYRLTNICRPKCACLTWSIARSNSICTYHVGHYKRLLNYRTADITLIYSTNYALVSLSSLLYSAYCYSTVLSSFFKLILIYSDLFWPLKIQIYITLFKKVWLTHFNLNKKTILTLFYKK